MRSNFTKRRSFTIHDYECTNSYSQCMAGRGIMMYNFVNILWEGFALIFLWWNGCVVGGDRLHSAGGGIKACGQAQLICFLLWKFGECLQRWIEWPNDDWMWHDMPVGGLPLWFFLRLIWIGMTFHIHGEDFRCVHIALHCLFGYHPLKLW